MKESTRSFHVSLPVPRQHLRWGSGPHGKLMSSKKRYPTVLAADRIRFRIVLDQLSATDLMILQEGTSIRDLRSIYCLPKSNLIPQQITKTATSTILYLNQDIRALLLYL